MKFWEHIGLIGDLSQCEDVYRALNHNFFVSDTMMQLAVIDFIDEIPENPNEQDAYILSDDVDQYKKDNLIMWDGNKWLYLETKFGYVASVESLLSPYWYNGTEWTQLPSGPADVSGPSSSRDKSIARWDGTTGKLLNDSSVYIDDDGNVTDVKGLYSEKVNTNSIEGINFIVSEISPKKIILGAIFNTILDPIAEIDSIVLAVDIAQSSFFIIENKSSSDILVKENASILTGLEDDFTFKNKTSIVVYYSGITDTFNIISGGGSGGGVISVDNIPDRNAIPDRARYEGMVVYVADIGDGTSAWYGLTGGITNDDWKNLGFSNPLFSDDVGSFVLSSREDSSPPEGTLPLEQEFLAELYPELAYHLWNADQGKWKYGGTGTYPSGTFWTPKKGAFFRIHGGTLDPDAATRIASGPNGVTGNAIGSMQGHAFQTHTHVQNAHTHVQNAHTHIQDSHNHILGINRIITNGTDTTPFGMSMDRINSTVVNNANPISSILTTRFPVDGTGINPATATNQNTTATNQNTTATNQNASASGTNSQASSNETRPVNISINAFIRFRPSGKGEKGDRGLQGGGLIVPSISARNSIPSEDREIGLTVTVLDDGNGRQKDYWLVGGITNANWEEKKLGGSIFTISPPPIGDGWTASLGEDVETSVILQVSPGEDFATSSNAPFGTSARESSFRLMLVNNDAGNKPITWKAADTDGGLLGSDITLGYRGAAAEVLHIASINRYVLIGGSN